MDYSHCSVTFVDKYEITRSTKFYLLLINYVHLPSSGWKM